MCYTLWTCVAGKNKIKNSERLFYQCFGWSFSCTLVCTHMYTFTHVIQVPMKLDDLKEFNIFIVISFYLKRLPKERRGWAGGAMAGDTGGIKRRECVPVPLVLLLGDMAKRFCSSRRCCTTMYFCLSRAELYRMVTFAPCNNMFRKKHWVSMRRVCSGMCEESSPFTPQTPERTTQVPTWDGWC